MKAEATDAARRLAHDVGKYVRFGAPEEPESDVGELRERLARDVAATRRTGARTESVVEVYDAWKRDEGPALLLEPALAEHLPAVEAAIAEIARLLPRLDRLQERELRALDAATFSLSRRCAAIARAARPRGE